MARNTPPEANNSDPAILRQVEAQIAQTQKQPVLTSPSTTSTKPAVRSSTASDLAPTAYGNDVVYPQSKSSVTSTSTKSSVNITSSANTSPSDFTTVYNTNKTISVNPITQTINQYTSVDSGVKQIIAGNGVTVSSTGNSGTGVVTITSAASSVGNIAALNLNNNSDTVLHGDGTWQSIGSVSTINLDGNAAHVLSGTGSWIASGGGSGSLGNLTANDTTLTTIDPDKNITIETVTTGGNLYWYNLYGDLLDAEIADYAEGIAFDSNGNVYIVGGDGNNGNISFVVKYDPAGTLQWQKTFDINGDYKSGEAITIDSNDNVYVAFTDWTSGYNYLVKLTTSGEITWQKEIQTNHATVGGLINDGTNIYIFMGSSSGETMMKFDTSGNVISEIIFEDSDTANSITINSSGQIYTVSPLVKYDTDGSAIYGVNSTGILNNTAVSVTTDGDNAYIGFLNSPFVQKINSNGESVWSTDFSSISTAFNTWTMVKYDAMTNSILCLTDSGPPQADLIIISLDANTGTLNWANKFSGSGIESYYYFVATGILEIIDGVLGIAAYTTTDTANPPSSSAALTLLVPVDGTGQGIYGDFVYLPIPNATVSVSTGATEPFSPTITTGSTVVVPGSLVMTNNDFDSQTVQLGPLAGPKDFVFGTNGTLTFPDTSVQHAAFYQGMNAWFTNLTATLTATNNLTVASQFRLNSLNIALGDNAGLTDQGIGRVAIGLSAGQQNQANDTVAIGHNAGGQTQHISAVAIGAQAGASNQGQSAVAIGAAAGYEDQARNSIVLNATGSVLNNTTENSLVVKPVRAVSGGSIPSGFYQVAYNPETGELIVVTP